MTTPPVPGFPNGLTTSYHYDTMRNRLLTTTDPNNATTSHAYDRRGRRTTLTRSIQGSVYPISTTYDAQDRPLTLTFPDGDQLAYHYGDHGWPVDLLLNGASLVKGATYNAFGKLTDLPLGNGLQTAYRYFGLDYQVSGSPNRWYGLPYQVQTGGLQAMQFATFDAFGNITGCDNAGNPLGITYSDHLFEALNLGYNELDQLLSFAGNDANEGYGYLQTTPGPPYFTDDAANLLSKGSASYSYPQAGFPAPNAPTDVSTVGAYRYDQNGNRQTDPLYAYTYDAENHLIAVQAGSNPPVLQNTDDGDGTRLVRVTSATTHFVGPWYEYDPNAGVATVYYPFNGIPVAMKQGSTLTYLHHDHLGSLVAASDANGTELCSVRYWPFGGLRVLTGTLPTDRLFTGQTRDLHNDSFYFFKARYYDATMGKFQTADSVVPDPTKPAALNRYAYALNNPLRLADPSGHFTVGQLKALGYTQAQIDAWARNDPNWAAIVASAQVGDIVTGLYPYTSGAPVQVAGTFVVLPEHALAQPERPVVESSLGFKTLGTFGRLVESRTLWRPVPASTQGATISLPQSSEIIQTPEGFLRAGPATHNIQQAAPFAERAYPIATEIQETLGLLDPFSPGALSPHGPATDIALKGAAEAVALRWFPRLAADADVLALAPQAVAAAYDLAYNLIYHRYGSP